VIRVPVAGADVTGLDFAFSFVPVVTERDDVDDDPANPRWIQGSLRQFIQNANAVVAAQSSMFRIPANELGATIDGGGGTVMLIQPTTALDPITDANTTIDASTQAAYTGDTNGIVAEVTTGPEVIVNYQGTVVGPGFEASANNVTFDSIGVANVIRNTQNVEGAGILVDAVNAATVRNSTIFNNHTYGIRAYNGADSFQFLDSVSRNNGLFNNGGDGVNLTDATNATIRNNQFISNNGLGVDHPAVQLSLSATIPSPGMWGMVLLWKTVGQIS
jgi:hypothetical protein